MMRDPIEAFEWLLTGFRSYMRGEVTWVEVRDLLREAEEHRLHFRDQAAVEQDETTD